MIFGLIRADKGKDKGAYSSIVDPASCRNWLATLVPIEAEESLHAIALFLVEMQQDHGRTAEHKYALFECIRASLLAALHERRREIETRSNLLEPEEGVGLWRLLETAFALRDAYASLVDGLRSRSEVAAQRSMDKASREIDKPTQSGRARTETAEPSQVDALHRAIDLNALVLMLNQRARIAVPDVYWNHHCELGKLVRQLDVHDEVVVDALRLNMTETCRQAFVAPILLALADPSTLSLSELSLTLNGIQLWAGRVAFRIDPGATITLTARQESKPGPCVFLGEYRVRFDTQSLLRNLARTLVALEGGAIPREWARERGVTLAACEALLQLLQRRWGVVEPELINYPEISWRPPSIATLRAVVGWQADVKTRREDLSVSDARGGVRGSMHAQNLYQYQRMREDRLALSQEEIERARLNSMLASAETWNLAGETAETLLCARRLHRPNLYLNQLVGFKLASTATSKDADMPYLLGSVQGMQQAISEDSSGLMRPSSTHMIRLRLFPGRVRPLQAQLGKDGARHAYLLMPLEFHDKDDDVQPLLDEIRVVAQRFSLILPVASYGEGKPVRLIIAGETLDTRMEQLLWRGLDFEQVLFRL